MYFEEHRLQDMRVVQHRRDAIYSAVFTFWALQRSTETTSSLGYPADNKNLRDLENMICKVC